LRISSTDDVVHRFFLFAKQESAATGSRHRDTEWAAPHNPACNQRAMPEARASRGHQEYLVLSTGNGLE
jgi:hypothetical protein